MREAEVALEELRALIERRWPDGAGPDPYDALNSPLVFHATARSRWARIAATQLLRQSPVDHRRVLGIHTGPNPKTVSLMARAYIRLSAGGDQPREITAERRAREALTWLAEHVTPGYSGAAWGYSFPWQSRRLCLRSGEPSVVCTSFVAHAFLDAFDTWGDPKHLEVARSAADFLLRDCPRHETSDGMCISYIPSRSVLVHNANILAASVLARVWRATRAKQDELRDVARRAASYTLADQSKDGAWPYDAPPRTTHSFVDGFHTGLVLEGLDQIAHSLDDEADRRVHRGLDFFLRRLLSPDGRPVRSVAHPLPVDIRDCAQAVLVCRRFNRSDTVERVLNWTMEHMRDRRGYYHYEWGTPLAALNRTPFPRWQAWMLLALAETCKPLRTPS